MANYSLDNATRRGHSLAFAYAYASIGTGGMLTNVFVLIVALSNGKFLKQSPVIAGLAISHFLCALAIGASGIHRVVNASILQHRLPAWSCVMRVYPAAYPFAFQTMGAMLVLVGTERFVVFFFPHWYRIHWTRRRCWKLIGLIYFFALCSFSVGLYIAWKQPPTRFFCGFMAVFSKKYVTYSNTVSAFGGTVAVVLTVLGLMNGVAKGKKLPAMSREASRHKRQLKVTRALLAVAISDFCLVVVPSTVFILWALNLGLFPRLTSGNLSNVTNLTYCINTMMSSASHLSFNMQFRKCAYRLIACSMRIPHSSSGMTPVCAMERQASTIRLTPMTCVPVAPAMRWPRRKLYPMGDDGTRECECINRSGMANSLSQ